MHFPYFFIEPEGADKQLKTFSVVFQFLQGCSRQASPGKPLCIDFQMRVIKAKEAFQGRAPGWMMLSAQGNCPRAALPLRWGWDGLTLRTLLPPSRFPVSTVRAWGIPWHPDLLEVTSAWSHSAAAKVLRSFSVPQAPGAKGGWEQGGIWSPGNSGVSISFPTKNQRPILQPQRKAGRREH